MRWDTTPCAGRGAQPGAADGRLGRETPAGDFVLAARAYGADIVALSHSAARPAMQVSEGADLLRRLLPPQVLVWVGTPHARSLRHLSAGVVALDRMDSIGPQAAQCRAAAAPTT